MRVTLNSGITYRRNPNVAWSSPSPSVTNVEAGERWLAVWAVTIRNARNINKGQMDVFEREPAGRVRSHP